MDKITPAERIQRDVTPRCVGAALYLPVDGLALLNSPGWITATVVIVNVLVVLAFVAPLLSLTVYVKTSLATWPEASACVVARVLSNA